MLINHNLSFYCILEILVYVIGFISSGMLAMIAYKNHWKIADYF